MALRLEGVSKKFHAGSADERVALDQVTLDLPEGGFVIVIGSNGSGKSTLLNVVSGHVPLDAGTVRIDGREVGRTPEHERSAWVARVLQDPLRGTLSTMTLEENLALADMRTRGRSLAPAVNAARRQRFADAIAVFGLGLEQRLQARAGLLSGGQRQVLALAMAVLNPPRVLLLDEHTAALDPRTAQLVMDATLRAVAAARITTVMVTHNMQSAITYGDRLVMMDAGRIRLYVGGSEKQALTVDALVKRFHIADDKMLLST